MASRGLSLGLAMLLVTSFATVVSADPPRPGTTESGLNESEEATLWAKQSAETYVDESAYEAAYGENRTTVHQIANGTDMTFRRPPDTAGQWTRYAHSRYEPGDSSASVFPPTANRTNSTYIKDAHATLFALSPATKTYLTSGDSRFYVAPEGEAFGTVDYRVALPADETVGNTTTKWDLETHRISEVRLYADDEEIARTDGTHRPESSYQLDDDVEEIRLEADINASINRTKITRTRLNDGSVHESITWTRINESVTVIDNRSVDVYDLQATVHYTEYPNGETGVSVYQTAPWQGYRLTEDGRVRVRGIWRFFTARETEWDDLVRTTLTDSERVDSTALPVYVHAYPSRLGPQTKPEYDGPTILEQWGQTRRSPKANVHENVTVDIVNGRYETTYGIAVRTRRVDREAVTVNGIVHDVKTDPRLPPAEGDRPLRETNLSATVLQQNESVATVRLTLREADTGDPIVLADDERVAPIADLSRDGYIEIDGQQVKTNATGEAVVHLTEPGAYTARYEPGSWLDHYPAYAGDSTVVRWHPLTTVSAWASLAIRFGLWFTPLLVALYAGLRLGSFLRWSEIP
jgi:hypothetical protein